MKPKCIIVIASTLAAAHAGSRTSANYTLATDIADAGGNRTTSAAYRSVRGYLQLHAGACALSLSAAVTRRGATSLQFRLNLKKTMNTMITRTLILLLLSVPALRAQVPQLINYQGRVAVGTVNFDGSGTFKFALVNAAGSTSYWSNDGTSTAGSAPTAAVTLTVTKGLYSVLLGDTTLANMTAVPATVFSNADVRLRVWFNDGTNGSQLLTPDQRIAAVGYAMVAGGLAPGATIPASAVTGTIPASQIVTPPPGMVLIPASAFTMGDSLDGLGDAVPISTTVSAFYMDVNEVSLSQWQSVYYWATSNGYTFTHAGAGKGANHPVQTVDWFDVVKWCNARSEQAGRTPVYYTDDAQTAIYKTGNVAVTNAQVKWTANGYRLATEAEWEKAARGGRTGLRFPWGNTITQNLANYNGSIGSPAYDLGPNGYNTIGSVGGTSPATSPAGSFAPNGYGLNDMAGNVFEWCWDWYGTPYAGGTDPHGAATGSYRVIRGGSWNLIASNARCADRANNSPPANAYDRIGFRAVLPLGQ